MSTEFWWANYLRDQDGVTFSGAFAEFQKVNIKFVMSVRPSVRKEKLGSQWTDCRQIWKMGIFRKSVEKIKVSLKSNKNDGYIT